ncbi:putative ribonuclease H-like domain-containing protein [Tanacetum coccineum]|uniref:Ribonuclease H-like domain-containing protein n=1 Tax=Tanacetum coccineum TaxID=301880 RepID=A0ABQ5FTE9_9ASTR
MVSSHYRTLNASENGTTTNKPKQQQQQLIPITTTISNIKLPILKKEEYDIWAMEMEHYLEYIDNVFGRKGRLETILLMAIPRTSEKISRIGHARRNLGSHNGLEGLEKGYDRFQQLLSQLEAYGAKVSTEDANHKFLRSLPPAWRVRIDGNKPVGFDKKKLECFKCHNTGHFARNAHLRGQNDGKKRDSFYQDQGAGKKEQNQNCLLTIDDCVVNWGEHTVEEEETNHALMAINLNTEDHPSRTWRQSWIFFLATKDETSGILQNFIRQIENQLNHKVKIIRSDNGTEFKNRDMLEFCGNKGIKQEYSNARTPQQNGVA